VSYLTTRTRWFSLGSAAVCYLSRSTACIRQGCAEVGIEGLVPHGLRHTTASLAIGAGANVKVVQRMLGHATAAMTLDLYGHLLDDDLSGAAEALGKAIDSTAVSVRYPQPSSDKAERISAAS
jgi:integrase